MFGVDFSELAILFTVALVLLGPTRMPGLVKKVGRWVGKARVMARDFQQQLENEVNLDELNKMTDLQTKQAATQSMPPPPPEFTGEPPPESTPAYPYASPYASLESAAAAAPEPSPPATSPTDDTYSHAHAAGDAPMPHEPEPADPSHLPPVDAGRGA